MEMIESYTITENGYHPFLIKDGWQLAQLNFTEEQHADQVQKLEIHRNTDEVFILVKGKAVLIISALINKDSPIFEAELMKPEVIYNIPQNTWHNIAMEKGSGVLIVEKSNTHLCDVAYFPLDIEKRMELRKMVKELFDSADSINGGEH